MTFQMLVLHGGRDIDTVLLSQQKARTALQHARQVNDSLDDIASSCRASADKPSALLHMFLTNVLLSLLTLLVT